MQEVSILFFRHGQSFQDKHDRPPGRTDIDGLIRRVQDQHRSLHEHALPRLGWFLGCLAVVAFVSLVPFMHGPLFLPLGLLSKARRRPSPASSLLLSWPAQPW